MTNQYIRSYHNAIQYNIIRHFGIENKELYIHYETMQFHGSNVASHISSVEQIRCIWLPKN